MFVVHRSVAADLAAGHGKAAIAMSVITCVDTAAHGGTVPGDLRAIAHGNIEGRALTGVDTAAVGSAAGTAADAAALRGGVVLDLAAGHGNAAIVFHIHAAAVVAGLVIADGSAGHVEVA